MMILHSMDPVERLVDTMDGSSLRDNERDQLVDQQPRHHGTETRAHRSLPWLAVPSAREGLCLERRMDLSAAYIPERYTHTA